MNKRKDKRLLLVVGLVIVGIFLNIFIEYWKEILIFTSVIIALIIIIKIIKAMISR